MEWKTIKHTQSTDGKTEKINCELRLDFPESKWNKNKTSPVLQLFYFDYKVESGWWLDKDKTKWHTHPRHKHCKVKFNYFQRMPDVKLSSVETSYDDFTIDFCKEQALRIFTGKLNDLLHQCQTKESAGNLDKQGVFDSDLVSINRSSYEIELYEKLKIVYEDAQKLIDEWHRLKELQYSNEHRFLFDAIKSFVKHCG